MSTRSHDSPSSRGSRAFGALSVLSVLALAACSRDFLEPDDRSPTLQSSLVRLGEPNVLPGRMDNGRVTAIAPGPGSLFLVGTSAGGLYRDDFKADMPFDSAPLVTLSGEVHAAAMADDGRTVAAVVADQIICFNKNGEGWFDSTDLTGVGAIDFDNNATQVAVAAFGVRIYNMSTGALIRELVQPMLEEGRSLYEDVVLLPDGSVLAASVEGVDFWSPGATMVDRPTLGCPGCEAYAATLADDGSLAAFGTSGGHLVVVDLRDGRVLADKTVSVETSVTSVAISSDLMLVAAFSVDGHGVLWTLEDQATAWQGSVDGLAPTSVNFVESDAALLVDSQTGGSDDGFGLARVLLPILTGE
jgi:hypothetical protein